MQGQTVFSEKIPVGETLIIWNAEEFSNGVYLDKMKSKNNILAT